MQPLHTISASGSPCAQVVQHLANIANYSFAGRSFRYIQTVVVPEVGQLGNMQYNVSMIFEVESVDALNEFLAFAQRDSQLKQLSNPTAPMGIVK
jgi:hypothetical protein